MKKVFITVIAMLLLLSACASTEGGAGVSGTQGAAPSSTAAVEADVVSPDETVEADVVSPDADGVTTVASAASADVKTVYGEISELIGNAVTVKLIEMPQLGAFERRMMEIPTDENGNPDYSQLNLPEGVVIGEDGRPDFSGMEMPEGVTVNEDGGSGLYQIQVGEGRPDGFTPGEGMPEGFTPGGGMPEGFTPGERMPEGFTPGDRGQRPDGEGGGPAREPIYTGEEVDIIIPVGLPITTTTVGENGIETEEIHLDDISIGDMITVVYKEDGVTIDTVSITPEGTVGGMSMNLPNGMFGIDAGGGSFFFSDGGSTSEGGEQMEMTVTIP
jgi:hypothetical protein